MRVCKKNIVTLLVLSFILSGCAARRYPVTYNFDKNMYKGDTPMNYHVLIDVFDDKRPIEEREGAVKLPGIALYSKDDYFEPNIAMQISQMLAKHLKESNLFARVEVRDVANNWEQDPEEMYALLSGQGVDLVITGTLKHFYGFQSGQAGPSVLLGPLAVFIEAFVNPKVVGANVEYADISIIDVMNKKTVWRGDIAYDFRNKDTFFKGPGGYALMGLKEANNRFVQKLKEVLGKE